MNEDAAPSGARIAELVARAQKGDVSAFEALVDAYKDRIYTYASRMLNDPSEAEDVAQDTFLRAYQSLPNFRGVSSFQTWLYRIASNLIIDTIRRRRRRDASSVSLDNPLDTDEGQMVRELPDEHRGPAELAESAVVQREVRQALAEMSPKLSSVLVMYDLQGLSYQEIAEILGCPLGTVKSRLFNARAQLREILERKGVL